MLENENCSICGSKKWESLDYLRDQSYWYDLDFRDDCEPVGFKICKDCGFVTYDYKTVDELQEHYDNERPLMSAMNIVTCNRKNEYHGAFLKDIFPSLKGKRILDIGCAQGSFLNYLNLTAGAEKENLHGTEWSDAFRFFGEFEYGLKITKEVDTTLKYDFISLYHVLEHLQNPEIELMKYVELLRDGGVFYISIPEWFSTLQEASGTRVIDSPDRDAFEDLYHLNHVNVFSDQSFKNILNKCGLEIIKEDKEMYGYTVLCKKADKKDITKEDYIRIKTQLEKQKQAIAFLSQNKPDEAIKAVPNFPYAYILKSLGADNVKDFRRQIGVLEEGLAQCNNNVILLSQMAKVCYQFNENDPNKQNYYSNNIKKSEKLFREVIQKKPGSEDSYFFLAMIHAKFKKEYEKAYVYMKLFLKIDPNRFQEAYTQISLFRKLQGG